MTDDRPIWVQEFWSAVTKKVARAATIWALDQLAHPKRPERTPRKLKKAAKKALTSIRMNP